MLPSTKPLPPPAGYRDPSSVSDPARVYTTHINLDIGVDFEIEMVGGTATLALSILDESVTHVDLDGRGLIVRKCVDANTELDLAWELERDVTSVGDRLRITLPDNAALKGHARVTVYYASRGTGAPGGGAIDWTAGDDTTPPFMFTQAQAIHARSFFPCQDTPAVKSTGQYNVKVITPHEDLQVLMSAVYLGPDGEGHSFVQNVPIPSYLVALAVGDLKKEQVSSRCAVWAQSDMLEQAKAKFEKMDDFLATAEKVAGPYVWGVCDVLVLPSSFPYGGMENPCLTFLTPSLLSGPPSSSVVIHEIAHSWSGNLVTARDFRHFWLNEGMTVKLERRILREAYGKEREGLDAHMGRTSLQNYIRVRGEDHPHTCLVVDLKDGQDPDDTFSCVPYEKGYNFLCYLEHLIVKEGGEQDAFDSTFRFLFLSFPAWQSFSNSRLCRLYFLE